MDPSPNMRLLDQSLSKYISSKDPTRKSTSKSVFMGKRQLDIFYANMYSKANQQIKLQQMKSDDFQDRNKLLAKQQQMIRDKIFNRTSFLRTESTYNQSLSNKENVRINKKPLISQNSFKGSKLIREKSASKFLTLANQQLMVTQYLEKNQLLRQRKIKSMAYTTKLPKDRMSAKLAEVNQLDYQNKSVACFENILDEEAPHRKAELIELYQKLYEQFTKQKVRIMHSKSKIQGKFSKGVIQQKPQLLKARQSICKFAMTLNNKRTPIKL